MEQNNAMPNNSLPIEDQFAELQTAGKWSFFIGIVYLVFSGLVFLTGILVFGNVDYIVSALMNVNGIGESAMQFMLGAGKWMFILFILICSCVLVLNGILLVRFGKSCSYYFFHKETKSLPSVFYHAGNYFLLTTILSIISSLFTLALIIFYMLKF